MEKVAPQAKKCHEALLARGIKNDMEVWDGYKHVDILIPWARIDIEVDGLQHYNNADQIISDFDRSYWSSTRDVITTLFMFRISS